uniref:Uncharacterized protein n=1 Tax=Parascaris equorum TaxID=6256 RepID=A0A914RN27_PAREQ
MNKLYASRVQYASPMPYMDEEVLIMDQEGLIWFGSVNDAPERLKRVKCVGDVQLICPSDHPRIIYAADAGNVWMIDLRDGTSHEHDEEEWKRIGEVIEDAGYCDFARQS